MTTIVFFDGVCNLCNQFVDWLLSRDRHGLLRFGSLQGKAARDLLGGEADALASIVVVRDGQIYRESDAVLIIGQTLGGVYAVLAHLFKWTPRWLRDSIYRFIGQRRYRLFGKRETCRIPTPEERARFLD